MVTFIFLYEPFTFFDFLDDIARHGIPFLIVVKYFSYLAPYLSYQLAPLAALVAVLVTLGVMSKNNEVVACKTSGIRLYPLARPLLLAGMGLAGVLVRFPYTPFPVTNRHHDA